MPPRLPDGAPLSPAEAQADEAELLAQSGAPALAQTPGGPGGPPVLTPDVAQADYRSSPENTPNAVQLMDPTTGAPVPLPPAQAEQAFRTGQLNVRADDTFHVKQQDGSVIAVPSDKLGAALDAGGSMVSPAEAREAELAGRYGATAGTIAAGLAGVARTATFGASDWLAGQDKASREVLDYLKREHPLSSGVGEIAGLLVGGLGGAAEHGAAGLLGEGMGARLAGQAARGAVESAQLGHTEAISEDSLNGGDHELTAEKYFAMLGESALWGGALGAGGGLLLEGAGALKNKLAGALARTPSAESVEQVAEKTFGYSPPGLGKAFLKAQSLVSGESEDAIREAYEARHIDAVAEKEGATRELTRSVNTILKDAGDLQEDELKGAGKRAHLAESVSKLEPDLVATHSANTIADARGVIGGMLGDAEQYGSEKLLTRMDAELARVGDKIAAEGEKGDNAEQFAQLDDTKRSIGTWINSLDASARRLADPVSVRQTRATSDVLKKLYGSLQKNLEDAETWGKAGIDPAKINEAWTAQIAAGRQFSQRLATVVGQTPFGAKDILEADPAKIATYVNSLTNPNQDLIHRAITEYVDTTKQLTKIVGERYDLLAPQAAKVQRALEAAESFQRTLEEVTPRLAKANQLAAMLGREGRGGGAVAAAFVGHALGGPAGGLLAGLAMQMATPARNAMRVAQLERLTAKFDGKIASAIERFFGRADEPSLLASRARPIPREPNGQPLGRATTRERFTEQAARLKRVQADPSILASAGYEQAAALADAAPKASRAYVGMAARGAAFLSSKFPIAPADPLTGKAGQPSEGQMERYLRYSDTVEHPEHVAEDLAKGRVTVEQVDTLQAVYPKLYAQLRNDVQQRLIEHASAGRAVTYQQRLQLGLLFHIDADPSMKPAAVNHAQATYALPPSKPPPGANVTAGGGQSALAKAVTMPADAIGAGT